MRVRYSSEFYKRYKKVNVRIQNAIDRKIAIFQKNPLNSELNNHELHDEYEGLKSINIDANYRAIYKEISAGKETFAYFTHFGTHKELYAM